MMYSLGQKKPCFNLYDVFRGDVKSKQLPSLSKCKCIFLTNLLFKAVYNFLYLKAWILVQINNFFSKVDLENIRNWVQ